MRSRCAWCGDLQVRAGDVCLSCGLVLPWPGPRPGPAPPPPPRLGTAPRGDADKRAVVASAIGAGAVGCAGLVGAGGVALAFAVGLASALVMVCGGDSPMDLAFSRAFDAMLGDTILAVLGVLLVGAIVALLVARPSRGPGVAVAVDRGVPVRGNLVEVRPLGEGWTRLAYRFPWGAER